MWVEELPNGKYKYFERYKDTYTEKWKRVSVTLNSGSNRAKKEAQRLLDDKIAQKIESSNTTNVSFHNAFNEWWEFHQKQIKLSSIKSLAASVKRISDTIEQGTVKYQCQTYPILTRHRRLDRFTKISCQDRTKYILRLRYGSTTYNR